MNYVFLIKDLFTNGFKQEFVYIIYIFAIVLGVYTIVNRNPISSVLCLIGLFVNVSCLLILISYNFLGLSYILVYVGAVSILFLFILMLINIRISELLSESYNIIPLAIYTVLLIYYIMVQILPYNNYYTDLKQLIVFVYSQS
jgi:NADH-ubiquinone oxidoreductase chain 6